jgi:hypothetical protein
MDDEHTVNFSTRAAKAVYDDNLTKPLTDRIAALEAEARRLGQRVFALETQCRDLREALERILATFDDGSWNAAVSLKIKVARAVLARYPKGE